MSDQTQPWAERTVEVPPHARFEVPGQQEGTPPQQQDVFHRGVASVTRRQRQSPRTEPFPVVDAEPSGWLGGSSSHLPLSYRIERWRRGGEWSAGGALFAFVCWGIWAISSGGDLTSPVVTFLLSLLVAVGLFALARLLGQLVWERYLGRVRHTARGAHLVTTLYLAGVGIAYLRQTEWVVSAWTWVFG